MIEIAERPPSECFPSDGMFDLGRAFPLGKPPNGILPSGGLLRTGGE